MKNSIFFFWLLLGTLACTSPNQSSKITFDGRTFKIENYTGGKLESTEMMTFMNGMVQNDECTKWGFGAGTYTHDETGNFKYTLLSEKEGKMDWEGQVKGASIEGKMVWVKVGQADIQYTFKGEEVKN